MSGEQEQLVEKIEALLQKKYGGTDEASMKKLFDAYDFNKDGKIDKSELHQLLKEANIGNTLTRGAWVTGIMEKLDQNADKAISWDEFKVATKG
jgi:Ca2+-binding EF-hand superfamily protein